MLKIFRKKIVSKFVLWGLLILILPAFVIWGGANLSQSKDKPTHVGVIDNKKISFDKLYKAMSGVRSQIILNYFNQPKMLEALLRDRKLLAKLGWDRLIMLNEAKKMKIKVINREIINYIRSHPLFVKNGDFDENTYVYILRNSVGLEPRDFEEAVRDNIAMQKVGLIITRDMAISEDEIADEYRKESERVKIAYFIITTKGVIDGVKVEEKAVRDFYDKHKDKLMAKANSKEAAPERQATFEESKTAIENYLKEVEARKIVSKDAEDVYNKLVGEVKDRNVAFSRAASRLGFEVKDSQLLSREDNLEDIGAASVVLDAASGLKISEISKPAEVKDGYIIFELVERPDVDKDKFKKEKDNFVRKLREKKSAIIMEGWLKKLEEKTKLTAKLEEI